MAKNKPKQPKASAAELNETTGVKGRMVAVDAAVIVLPDWAAPRRAEFQAMLDGMKPGQIVSFERPHERRAAPGRLAETAVPRII